MIFAGFFILTFTTLQLLVALVNLIFSQSFPGNRKTINELISVLIPARNEENNIEHLLNDLQQQDYQNLEIIVFNDQSTDDTERIIKKFTENDKRIQYINSSELPDGWVGKNYACHTLAKKANGKYLLFLDADVRIRGSIIKKMLMLSQKYKLTLLTIFPIQVMRTPGEKMTVPNMNYILLTLLPLILVRKSSFPSLAAANGQCMFFLTESYNKILPHEMLKDNIVEDIQIAKLLKRRKKKIACLTGKSEISCRMYTTYAEAVDGFSRNVIMFFSNSFMLAVLFWLITTFGFIFIYYSFSLLLFIIYVTVLVLIRIIISVISKQPVMQNLVLAIPQQLTIGLFIFRALTNKIKKQHTWKGRNIS